MRNTARGSGRTYRAVEALPDGGTYIVYNVYQTAEIRDMLAKQGRKPNAINIVPYNRDLLSGGRLKGLTHASTDHDVWRHLSEPEAALLRRTLEAIHPSIKAA